MENMKWILPIDHDASAAGSRFSMREEARRDATVHLHPDTCLNVLINSRTFKRYTSYTRDLKIRSRTTTYLSR